MKNNETMRSNFLRDDRFLLFSFHKILNADLYSWLNEFRMAREDTVIQIPFDSFLFISRTEGEQ